MRLPTPRQAAGLHSRVSCADIDMQAVTVCTLLLLLPARTSWKRGHSHRRRCPGSWVRHMGEVAHAEGHRRALVVVAGRGSSRMSNRQSHAMHPTTTCWP